MIIEELHKDYDDELRESISHRGGPGGIYNNLDYILSLPLICLAKKFVSDACEIINRNKNLNITADFEGDMLDICAFNIWTCFSINTPDNKFYGHEIVDKSDRLIKMKMPSSSIEYNRDLQGFYKELMTVIYEKYQTIAAEIEDYQVRQAMQNSGIWNRIYNSPSSSGIYTNTNGATLTANSNGTSSWINTPPATFTVLTQAEVNEMINQGTKLLKISEGEWCDADNGNIYIEADKSNMWF